MKRLALVVLISLGGFAAAFVSFGDAARANCVLEARPDTAYEVALDQPARVGDEPVLRVTRDGEPVSGAWVCATLTPSGTSGPVAAAEARELGAGRYALPLDLAEPGTWSGTVLIGEDGSTEVSTPLTVKVAASRR